MEEKAKMKRLMIFIDETDRWQKGSLSAALVDRIKKEGGAGATVIKGATGFGAHRSIHTSSIMDLASSLPEIVLVIDRPEVIDAVVPRLKEMVQEGLFVIDEVDTIRMTKGS
ncbi:MAG: DUF190 domain-containing protein [Candidatus Obscuribacterales bacterium]|nr:DUF190 domain-containing protein [Candidatus Obscuribacterales bacterium]